MLRSRGVRDGNTCAGEAREDKKWVGLNKV